MSDASPPHRMTDAELAEAVARMFPTEHPAPLPVADVLAVLVDRCSGSLLDLWTLRDSIVTLRRPAAAARLAALDALPAIAAHLDAATRDLEAIAAELGVTLPPESPLFDA